MTKRATVKLNKKVVEFREDYDEDLGTTAITGRVIYAATNYIRDCEKTSKAVEYIKGYLIDYIELLMLANLDLSVEDINKLELVKKIPYSDIEDFVTKWITEREKERIDAYTEE